MESFLYLQPGITVTFRLEGRLPIFNERYVSPQAGTVVLRGLINQKAHIETLDGRRYRMLSPGRAEKRPNLIAYPIIRLSDKAEVLRLCTSVLSGAQVRGKREPPPFRYTAALNDESYVFKRASGVQWVELWDGMERQRIVKRELGAGLHPDLNVLLPVPALLVLLFPWVDSKNLIN